MSTPIIAIVGRPNVGKSTLFNRIIGERRAIVEDVPGVTRDRNYAHVLRFDVPFFLVDTGGYEINPADPLQKFVVEQTQIAIDEADIIFCLFDGSFGVHPGDEIMVSMLRSCGKEVYYIVNKCDGEEQNLKVIDFYSLGVGDLCDISALYGREVNNLVENALAKVEGYEQLKLLTAEEKARKELEYHNAEFEIEKGLAEYCNDNDDDDDDRESDEFEFVDEENVDTEPEFAPVYMPGDSNDSEEEYLKEFRIKPIKTIDKVEIGADLTSIEESDAEEEIFPSIPIIKVAIVGRPNVGKSTLFNRITGTSRSITSPIAGTTRDSVNTPLKREGQDYLLVDTAGLRKKGRITDNIERYSTLRALKSLGDADVAVLVLDAEQGPTEQDAKIAGLAHEQGLGLIICVNKWDLIEKNHKTIKDYTLNLRDAFKFARYAPIIFTSALSGKRCSKVIDMVREVAVQRQRHIPTSKLNRVLMRAHKKATAPSYRGKLLKFYFAAQVTSAPPRFALFFNFAKEVHFSYLRCLKNEIRDQFGFVGNDIKLIVRKRGKALQKK